MSLRSALGVGILLAAAGPSPRAAPAPLPVMVLSAPGRFEVAALDASDAHAVAAAGTELWRHLAAPLALPDAFPTPIFVRVVPEPAAEDGAAATEFSAVAESGGVVSVRLVRRGALDGRTVQRALIRGLLLRLRTAAFGGERQGDPPAWLETGLRGWAEMRGEPAQLDRLKYEAARETPLRLAELWAGAAREPGPAYERAATVWVTLLLGDTGRAGEWPALLRALLGGAEPAAALAASYPGRFDTAEERELWWASGWHHVRRLRTLPHLEAGESRAELEALVRFVFAAPDEDRDLAVPLAEAVQHPPDGLLDAEIGRRRQRLERLVPALHPFYRNAGLALADVWAARGRPPAQRAAALAAFAQEWRDAEELAALTTAVLDRWERQPAR
ncbi:MAG: hypothetical protein B9S34_10720 [Opitutia bacterium Tous-C1TDCM]|nr:MAG: hypothetical protein B9S34_10720 [Opitutae bacterium Tous-C1TDCM]